MRSSLLGAVVAAGVLGVVPVAAQGATPHPGVVSSNAADYVPQLVPSGGVARPRVDAIEVGGGTTFAGGLFDTVKQGGATLPGFRNLFSFNTATGAVNAAFQPTFNDQIRALEYEPSTNSIFVAGDFTTVNGVARGGLVKLDAATGRTDTSFKPYFAGGQVNDLALDNIGGKTRLVVAGAMSKKLASVDPATGKADGYLDAVFSDAIPNARGTVSVFQIAINPDGTRLIATGNFRTVSAAGGSSSRRAFVMLNLPGSGSVSVNPWYYPGFGKECAASTTNPPDGRRIANLQGVDWSPNGAFFDVTATGKVPLAGDVWHAWDSDAGNAGSAVCDAVGRFSLADDNQAVWINYTGGDSVWVVQDTGAAVYIQGHFKYVDNPDGYASLNIGDKHTGQPATPRSGVAAINPASGRAIDSWHPATPTRTGGKALLATAGGMWYGNDSAKFGNEQHYGLAFTPVG